MQARRVRLFLAAGLIDSFCLALGWTIFVLHAVSTQGLRAAGLYNGAMLVGVALSAPAAGWLSTRLHGRALLQSTAVVEGALRVGIFVGLLKDAPVWLVALGVVLANISGWTGYAGMRAEVATASRGSVALTWYAVCVGAIEAAGAACASLLPTGSNGLLSGTLLVAVIAVYGACLLPTILVAQESLTRRSARPPRRAAALRRHAPRLGGAFLVMVFASGLTFLAVPLTSTLYGSKAVAAAAGSFAAGALLAPLGAKVVDRIRIRDAILWPALGLGITAGWIAAPVALAGLLVAQFLSGFSLTVFDGAVDMRFARTAEDDSVTSTLAYSAASRALGSSVAVAVTPVVVSAGAIGALAAGESAFLAAAIGAVLLLPHLGARRARRFGRAGKPIRSDAVVTRSTR